jgi:hypothetical protein
MHERWGSGFCDPVVGRQIQVHRADTVRRAHQIEFAIPREITKIDRSKSSVSENEPGRLTIIRIHICDLIFLLDIRACCILAAAGQIRSDELIGRSALTGSIVVRGELS